jgi:multiple sugar transport system ATP-binding protein
MKDGVIEQQGAPMELYDRPANRFVAGFIGSPAMNLVPAIGVSGGKVTLELPDNPTIACAQPVEQGRKVLAGMRPENLRVCHDGGEGFTLPVTAIESTGSLTYIVLGNNPDLTLVEQGRERVKPGDTMKIAIEPALVHLFDPVTGKRI